MKHEGWKYYQGINKSRMRQGAKDEVEIFKKICDNNFLPKNLNEDDFYNTNWNCRVDYKPKSDDIDITIEIKRRFLSTDEEYPFNKIQGTKSTLINYKKFEYLRENNGWLYLQYNDKLLRCDISTIGDKDFIICYPFRTKHVSINLDCFECL